MIIFRKVADVADYLSMQRKEGHTVAFVPTMGALHQGHISLIEEAKKGAQLVVCSIFINPVQFNNKEDFAKYPVTTERDIELLTGAQCDVLFMPVREEVYSKDYVARHYDLGPLEFLLEGEHRPGHFQGVAQVVDKLLDIMQPDSLYIGQKDYQQCLVIKQLLGVTGRQTTVHIVPTKREASGLAMSSRNLRLSDQQLKKAALISEVLRELKDNVQSGNLQQLIANATDRLNAAGFIVNYVAIANAQTLQPTANMDEPLVALVAASLNGVRLIDNEVLNPPSKS